MLNAKEYAAQNNVPVELSSEIVDFALFTIDMTTTTQNGEFMFPKMKRLFNPLWKVKPATQETRTKIAAINAAEKEKCRQANLALYISRGYAFEENNGESED